MKNIRDRDEGLDAESSNGQENNCKLCGSSRKPGGCKDDSFETKIDTPCTEEEIIEQSLEKIHDLPETANLTNNQLLITIARYMEWAKHMSLEILAEGSGCWVSSNWDQPSRGEMDDATFQAGEFDDGTDE